MSCAQAPVTAEEPAPQAVEPVVAAPPAVDPRRDEPRVPRVSPPVAEPEADVQAMTTRIGSGVFLKHKPAKPVDPPPAGGDVTLNFEDGDLREVLKSVLGDILEKNYIIDPGVSGKVTLRTSRPLPRAAVLPVLETALLQNGQALVQDDDVIRIMPIEGAAHAGLAIGVGAELPEKAAGFGIQIVPLRYVAAQAINKVLQPFLPRGGTIQVDEQRNLLILSGPRSYLAHTLETIDLFDVNWLRGMSFAMVPLEYSEAPAIAKELEQILGKGPTGSLPGAVRLIPIQRLNALLVIAQQAHMLEQIRQFVGDLDRGGDSAPGKRLYVYDLKNGKADHIAGLLAELFSDGTSSQPGEDTGMPSGQPSTRPDSTATAAGSAQDPQSGKANAAPRPAPAKAVRVAAGSQADGAAITGMGEVSIIADQDNNLILVLAEPRDYRVVESAIRRLDVPLRQVLIDASIVEVLLTDDLAYGVQWLVNSSPGRFSGTTSFLPSTPGGAFTYTLTDIASNVRFLFDFLASESRLKVLSSPHVMVLDNQTASFNVGTQIAVTTRTLTDTTNPDSLTEEVQYRDTGTILQVTPRINAGGLVTLEISQEVSRQSSGVGAGGNPDILQRTIQSTVAVQSGKTIVLGGLIDEQEDVSEEGIPLLKDIPLLGVLFQSKSKSMNRTELLVTITPRVIEDPRDAWDATLELRRRLKGLVELHPELGG